MEDYTAFQTPDLHARTTTTYTISLTTYLHLFMYNLRSKSTPFTHSRYQKNNDRGTSRDPVARPVVIMLARWPLSPAFSEKRARAGAWTMYYFAYGRTIFSGCFGLLTLRPGAKGHGNGGMVYIRAGWTPRKGTGCTTLLEIKMIEPAEEINDVRVDRFTVHMHDQRWSFPGARLQWREGRGGRQRGRVKELR